VIGMIGSLGGVLGAVFSGPVLALVAAVGGLFLLFRKEGETPMQTLGQAFMFFQRTWEGIRAVTAPAVDKITEAFERIGSMLGRLSKPASDVADALRAGIAGIFESIVALVEPAINIIASAFSFVVSIFETLLPPIMGAVAPILGAIFDIGKSIIDVLGKAFGFIGEVLGAVFGVLQEVVFPIIGAILNVAIPVITTLFQVLAGVFSFVAAILGHVFGILREMVKVIVDFFNPAWEETKFLLKLIGSAIGDFLAKPIKVVAGILAEMLGVIVDIVNFVGGTAKGLAATVQSMREFAGTAVPTAQRATDAQRTQAQMNAKEALAAQTKERGLATPKSAEQAPMEAKVNVKLDQKTNVCMNGRQVAGAVSKHQTEIQERAGFNQAPFQRKLVQVAGARA
jgi:phage-related protein